MATATVIGADDGAVQLAFGRPLFKIGPDQGSTGLGLIDAVLAPGDGFPFPHVHDELEEAFYVLDGEVAFLLDDTWMTARPGCTVFIPAGCVHAFQNKSGASARQLVLGSSPEMVALVRDLGTNPRDRWDEICARSRTRLAYDSPHFPRP